jgi:signal transduction histidine kinase
LKGHLRIARSATAQGPEILRLPRYVRTAVTVLLVCAGYYAAGVVSLVVRFPSSGISIMWSATGILMAMLLLTSRRTWWVYVLAVLPAHLHLVYYFQPGVPLVTMLTQFVGNTSHAILCAILVRRFAPAPRRLNDLKSMAVFVFLGGGAIALIVSAAVVYCFKITGWVSSFWPAWGLRTLSNTIGQLSSVPLILTAVSGGLSRMRHMPMRSHIEFVSLAAGVYVITSLALGWTTRDPMLYPALLLAPLPLLLWAAVRFGVFGSSLSLLIITLVLLLSAFGGSGPFATVSQSDVRNVASLQLYLIIISVPLMLLAALIEERQRVGDALNRLNAELERRVIERTAALEAKTRELETFACSVAHDLKAPLRGIDGYSRLLLEDHLERLDEEGRAFLDAILRSTKRMNQLIDDLLAYSLIERRALSAEPIELRPFVETLVEERRTELIERRINLTIEVNGGVVVADAAGLSQALRNYLDNAIKFTSGAPEPRIEVGAEETEKSCRLWVRDNGVGFDMKYQDRIFEVFQRLHRLEDYPGTGIGLAIVRKAMERMGGRAWAESGVGRGATFYLELTKQHDRLEGGAHVRYPFTNFAG